jgi:tRNA pseudouridine55 synthase
VNGILNINKPSGMTSFAVVTRVKRLSREKRVGHAGTLDPLASGVLPVCLGKATRVIEYLLESSKTYRATLELGVTTDTGDADGSVVERRDASGVSRETMESALNHFRGHITQTPPMFSALKHHGTPLYRLARAGLSVERQSRSAEIYELELTEWTPPSATIKVSCSRGTYIRTLAEDIGKTIGCGASLKDLARIRYGPFDVGDSVSLADLEEAFESNDTAAVLHPIDSVLSRWPVLVADAGLADDIRHGRPLPEDEVVGGIEREALVESKGRVRACTIDGCFLGVLRFNSEEREWQPEKVFS